MSRSSEDQGKRTRTRLACLSILFTLLFVCCLFIAHYFSKHVVRSAFEHRTAYSSAKLVPFHDDEIGLSLHIPSAWSSIEVAQIDPSLLQPIKGLSFISPRDRAVLALAVLPIDASMADTDAAFFFDRAALPAKKLLSSERSVHNGRTFQMLVMEYVSPSQKARMIVVRGSTIVAGRHYKLGLTGFPCDLTELGGLFDRMIETLTIRDGED